MLCPAIHFGQCSRVAVRQIVLGQPVGQVDDAHAQGSTIFCGDLGSDDRIILIGQESIQATHSQGTGTLHICRFAEHTPVDGTQRTQSDFSLRIVDVCERFRGQIDFTAEIALPDGSQLRYDGPV